MFLFSNSLCEKMARFCPENLQVYKYLVMPRKKFKKHASFVFIVTVVTRMVIAAWCKPVLLFMCIKFLKIREK